MKQHVYKTNRDDLLKAGKKVVKANSDTVLAHRATIVNLVVSGMPATAIAENADVDARTIQKWVEKADSEGFDALRPQPKSGRPHKLSSEQKVKIKASISEDPSKHAFDTWGGVTWSKYIEQTYDVKISIRSCQRLFKELGFSLIRPQPFPNHEVDQIARDDFKKN